MRNSGFRLNYKNYNNHFRRFYFSRSYLFDAPPYSFINCFIMVSWQITRECTTIINRKQRLADQRGTLRIVIDTVCVFFFDWNTAAVQSKGPKKSSRNPKRATINEDNPEENLRHTESASGATRVRTESQIMQM